MNTKERSITIQINKDKFEKESFRAFKYGLELGVQITRDALKKARKQTPKPTNPPTHKPTK